MFAFPSGPGAILGLVDKRYLSDCLAAGMSLDAIAAEVGRHPSTVSYWLNKHGLKANGAGRHAPRGGIAREELEPLVNSGTTLAEIAAELDRSVSNVRYWISRHGLPRPLGARQAERDRALEAGERTLRSTCPSHGETEFIIENSGRVRCKRCRMEAVSRWRRRAKERLVAEAGGACQICGYDRCTAALQFHHLDPAQKSFALAQRGLARSIEALRAEAAKCVLLCGNCHAEVEVGFTSLEAT